MDQQRLCLTCGAPFDVPASSRRKFCSTKCWPHDNAHSRRPKALVDVQCATCGKEFQRKAWEVEQRKRKGWAMYCSVECRDAAKKGRRGQQRVERVRRTCEGCGSVFELLPSDKPKRFCSVACARATVRGSETGRRPQHDKKSLSRDGYVLIYVPIDERPPGQEHLARHAEHRYVMSKMLGRWPTRRESIHHINGNKTDNRPENLQLRQGGHGKGRVLRCRCCGSSDIEAVEI